MKSIPALLLLLFVSTVSSAQFFKKLAQKAKEEAQWRAERTENQKISEGLDSLENLPKKMKDKNKSRNKTEASPNTNDVAKTQKEKGPNAPANDPEDMTPKDGYINFTLS